MQHLSIILPCFNPPNKWETFVFDAYKTIRQQIGSEPELIIVNDGSSEDISPAIAFLKLHIPTLVYCHNERNMGKGAALRDGVKLSIAAYTVYTDIDFPYDTASFLKIYEALKSNKIDIAVGVKDESYYHHLPKYRRLISKFLRKSIGFCFKMPITDTQCGLKGFNEKGKNLFLNTSINRYLFDLEFVYLASKKQYNQIIEAIPVTLRPNVFFRKMNLIILSTESFNFLKILLK